MNEQSINRKTELLQSALSSLVGTYYEINLTRNTVPGTIIQRVDGKEYNINEIAGLPENARFTDIVQYGVSHVPEEDKENFLHFMNLSSLLDHFEKKEHTLSFYYRTENIFHGPMFAEQHIFMYRETDDSDVLAFTYIIDRTEHYRDEQYRTTLEKDNRNLNDLLAIEKQYTKVLSALSKIYCQIFSVNIPENLHIELYHGNSAVPAHTRTEGAQNAFHKMVNLAVAEESQSKMKEFVNFSTLPERLKAKDHISCLFHGIDDRWIKASFIVQNRNSESVVTDVLFTLEDVTKTQKEEERREQMLRDAADIADAANKAKSQFMLSMSHDIRTPLNGIMGLLEINGEHLDNVALLRENHPKLVSSCEHLLSLVNDILQFSKLEDGSVRFEKSQINLADLSNEIGTMVQIDAKKHDIQLKYTIQNTPYPDVLSNPLYLKQIFMNIYSNCIKYNRPNGTITTSVQFLGTDRNIVTYQWQICDTGIGMTEEFLKHIFEPFAQENRKVISEQSGTGLGMAIVKRLLDGLNGTIQIRSKLGVGSTFLITIPFEIAEARKETVPIILHGWNSLQDMKLLLVEDNELNQEITRYRLEEKGAIVTTANNGKEAVEIFTQNRSGTFDAILMDILMPVMNGLNATRSIRSSGKKDAMDIPIIALTANAFNENIAECHEAGMNAHITKPFHIDTAVEVICSLIKKKNGKDSKEPM